MENVKNERIELIPKLPYQCKVSIKERIAPLTLKFEFYDLNTNERIPRTDVQVSIDPKNKHPTTHNCLASRMMSDPNAMTMHYYNGKNQRGKPFPELDPMTVASHKIKFPQQLYISIITNRGYYVTITAWFPKEKLTLKENREKSLAMAENMKKPDGVVVTQSINQLRYEEFIELQSLKKRNANDAHLMKLQYVEEEIQRMEDNEAYESEIMKKSEKKLQKRQEAAHKIFGLKKHQSMPFINISSVGTDLPDEKVQQDNEFVSNQFSQRTGYESALEKIKVDQ